MIESPALAVRNISKRFGGVHALTDVELTVGRGEILGLMGENGSGKSTLVKILSGYHAPERGAEGEVWGQPLHFPVHSSEETGIAVAHQDLALVDDMSVTENLGITVGYGSSGIRRVNWRQERRRCEELLQRFGVAIDPRELVGQLSPAERAVVSIVRATRALSQHVDDHILILDEPTSYLSGAEAHRVMEVIRAAARSGASVIFISHHLHEVIDVCDRIAVLRDGRMVADLDADGATEHELIAHMLGRELVDFYPERLAPPTSDDVLLSVDGLSGSIVDDLSFDLRSGEIVGVTGLAGMGQQELPMLLAGVTEPAAGRVGGPDGEPLGRTPHEVLESGVVLVPSNRQRDGVWLDATATENISLPLMGSYFRRGWLQWRSAAGRATELMHQFSVQPPVAERKVSSFSGGNQQKIVLAKWMQAGPRVLLLDEPTQGVDAGARREILEIVRDAASDGAGVVIFSSDLEQLANVCTRTLVLWRGRLAAELEGDEITEDALLEACQQAAHAAAG